jgi:anhydro-N-acetylmuramic acid kinase
VADPLEVLGLMSGTSADGIDAALVTLPETPSLDDLRDVRLFHRPFGADERRAVFALFDTERTTARDVAAMNFQIGEWLAAAALGALAEAGLDPEAIDLVGSHGQTIYHQPPGEASGRVVDGSAGILDVACTLQIGEPSVIAERTGITTVADFRVRDMAAGGQGAPLVSYVDLLLFRHPTERRAVLNLGGIANLTLLPPSESSDLPLAFDTGPANMILDWLAVEVTGGSLRYDVDGALAAAGTVDETLLDQLLADTYFEAPPPKTTGRERYGAPYARSFWENAQRRGLHAEDALATALALTAETVAGALRPLGVSEVIAGGGGTRNPVLMAALARRLPGVRVSTHETYGVSSQAKEAASFAILAAAAIRNQPNTLPSCTGARHAVVMGKITPGRNYAQLMRRVFQP